jgi:hypothetical protein
MTKGVKLYAMKKNVTFFKQFIPNVYSIFEDQLLEQFDDRELEDFFRDLRPLYDTHMCRFKLLRSINTLFFKEEVKRNHILKFLINYAPRMSFSPNCVLILEKALNSPQITFENRVKTIKKLCGDRVNFWGKYCELETANSCALVGADVVHLERDSCEKYPDLKVAYQGVNFNIEVTNRTDSVATRDSVSNILREKIEDEATQLPSGEINIVFIFMSPALLFSNKFDIKKMINMFDPSDVMYERTGAWEKVRTNYGSYRRKPVMDLIINTQPELMHVSAVITWFFGQSIMGSPDKQIRTMQCFSKDEFPNEIVRMLEQVQALDISN